MPPVETRSTTDALTRQHGPAIRALRIKDGHSVKTFAAMVPISYSHYQNIEHENRLASLTHLNRIARLLGVPLAAISREIQLSEAEDAAELRHAVSAPA